VILTSYEIWNDVNEYGHQRPFRYMNEDDEDRRDAIGTHVEYLLDKITETDAFRRPNAPATTTTTKTTTPVVAAPVAAVATATSDGKQEAKPSAPSPPPPPAIVEEKEDNELVAVNIPGQDVVYIGGRILSAEGGGQLNVKSVELEGERNISQGRKVPLRLGLLGQISVFPGQVSLVKTSCAHFNVIVNHSYCLIESYR
jgi:hypothetical protein